jgi:integrase
MARVYRRGRKLYMDARRPQTGERVRKVLPAETKREAERVLRAILRKWELGEALPGEQETVSFRTLADEYVKVCVEGGRNRNGRPHKASTVAGDKGRIEKLKEHFGDRPVGEIRAEDIERYLDGLTGDGRTVATRNRYLAILRPMLRLAAKRGWLQDTPELPHQAGEEPKVGTVLSDDDLGASLEKWDREPGLGERVRFLLLTGFRLGEAFVTRPGAGLQWEDVDFQRGTATLRDTKTGGDAVVVLHPAALQILRDQYSLAARRALQEGTGKPRGAAWTGHPLDDPRTLRQAFKAALKAAGVDTRYRIHDLRAQFAVALLRQGEDIETVRRALRHKHLTTTARYLRHVAGTVESAVRRLKLPAAGR